MPTATRSVQPIHPSSDPRVRHVVAQVNGYSLHYVIGEPKSGDIKGTILCIHGFPDLWYTWRYTIPVLLDLGLRVIAPDCLGYGGSSAPKSPLSTYSLKTNADTFAALLTQLSIPTVVVLAHDWGSMIAWRFYNFYPSRVSHMISLCVPYAPPHPQAPYLPLEEVVRKLPNFTYQIGLSDPQTERELVGKDNIRKFLKAMYRGIGDGRGPNINVTKDMLAAVGDMKRSWILNEEELEWYVDEFSRVGMHGPLSYYKTRKVNYDDEKTLVDPNIHVPVLFVGATRDFALPPSMALAQGRFIKNLTKNELKCSHWMVWEVTDEVNAVLKEWIEGVVFGPKAKL